jgi:hypothetical protein
LAGDEPAKPQPSARENRPNPERSSANTTRQQSNDVGNGEQRTQRIEALKTQIGLLVKDQKYEQAEALRRELNQLLAGTEGRQGPRWVAGPGDERSGEFRRLVHLRVAIENLRAAGMQEEVDRLTPELTKLQASLPEGEARLRAARESGQQEERGRGDAARVARFASRAGADPRLDELHGQVQQLRQEVAEMKAAIKKLTDTSAKPAASGKK